MIYLEQGQKVLDKPELVVYEPTGERNDTDMVICAEAKNPGEPFCWLEAQYIAYGGVVYKISDEKELETEILKIDPDSTINEVAADPVVISEDPSLHINDPIQEVQIQPSAAPKDVVAPVEPAPTPAPVAPELGAPISETATSTTPVSTSTVAAPFEPEIVPIADPASTSTSPILEPIGETPSVEPVIETSPIIEPVISYIKKRVRKSLS